MSSTSLVARPLTSSIHVIERCFLLSRCACELCQVDVVQLKNMARPIGSGLGAMFRHSPCKIETLANHETRARDQLCLRPLRTWCTMCKTRNTTLGQHSNCVQLFNILLNERLVECLPIWEEKELFNHFINLVIRGLEVHHIITDASHNRITTILEEQTNNMLGVSIQDICQCGCWTVSGGTMV